LSANSYNNRVEAYEKIVGPKDLDCNTGTLLERLFNHHFEPNTDFSWFRTE